MGDAGGQVDWSVDGETSQQWEIADKRENIEEHYARKEAGRRLTRAIHRLRPALRSIIEIQQSYDSSVKEIATVAGISVAAAKSRLSRARTVRFNVPALGQVIHTLLLLHHRFSTDDERRYRRQILIAICGEIGGEHRLGHSGSGQFRT